MIHLENESTEWDKNKADTNVRKHEGLTFEEAAEVFDDPFALEKFDTLHSTIERKAYYDRLRKINNSL